MKLFTEQLNNNRFNIWDEKDVQEYLNKFQKELPKDIVEIINLLIRYRIFDEAQLNIIEHGSPMDLKTMGRKIGTGDADLEKIRALIQDAHPEDLPLIPLHITEEDWKALKKGDKELEDINLDLESDKGRAQVAKKYANLAIKIASKYRGQCGLDWNSLVSAANMGLVLAMNKYKKPSETTEEQKWKSKSFKQYAGWQIKYQILSDMEEFQGAVRRTTWAHEKAMKNKESIPSDVYLGVSYDDEEGNNLIDRITGLHDDPIVDKVKDDGHLGKIFDIIDKKFSDKTKFIFYSYFGLNGYKKLSNMDLSKKYGVSYSAISQQVKSVIKFLQSDPKTRDLLQDLLDIYSESLIGSFYNKNLDDRLVKDEIYNVIREAFEYYDKNSWNNRITECLEGMENSDIIRECLNGDWNTIDEKYDEHESEMKTFLSKMYPTTSIYSQSDTEVIEQMSEIQKHNKEVNC